MSDVSWRGVLAYSPAGAACAWRTPGPDPATARRTICAAEARVGCSATVCSSRRAGARRRGPCVPLQRSKAPWIILASGWPGSPRRRDRPRVSSSIRQQPTRCSFTRHHHCTRRDPGFARLSSSLQHLLRGDVARLASAPPGARPRVGCEPHRAGPVAGGARITVVSTMPSQHCTTRRALLAGTGFSSCKTKQYQPSSSSGSPRPSRGVEHLRAHRPTRAEPHSYPAARCGSGTSLTGWQAAPAVSDAAGGPCARRGNQASSHKQARPRPLPAPAKEPKVSGAAGLGEGLPRPATSSARMARDYSWCMPTRCKLGGRRIEVRDTACRRCRATKGGRREKLGGRGDPGGLPRRRRTSSISPPRAPCSPSAALVPVPGARRRRPSLGRGCEPQDARGRRRAGRHRERRRGARPGTAHCWRLSHEVLAVRDRARLPTSSALGRTSLATATLVSASLLATARPTVRRRRAAEPQARSPPTSTPALRARAPAQEHPTGGRCAAAHHADPARRPSRSPSAACAGCSGSRSCTTS